MNENMFFGSQQMRLSRFISMFFDDILGATSQCSSSLTARDLQSPTRLRIVLASRIVACFSDTFILALHELRLGADDAKRREGVNPSVWSSNPSSNHSAAPDGTSCTVRVYIFRDFLGSRCQTAELASPEPPPKNFRVREGA